MECEEEFRPLLNGDERVCVEGRTTVCQVNPWQSLAEPFFIGGVVKISLELSINTDYMHVDTVKESGRKDEEKGKCKIKKLESKGSRAISAVGVMTALLHTWFMECIIKLVHTHGDRRDKVNFMHRLHDA